MRFRRDTDSNDDNDGIPDRGNPDDNDEHGISNLFQFRRLDPIDKTVLIQSRPLPPRRLPPLDHSKAIEGSDARTVFLFDVYTLFRIGLLNINSIADIRVIHFNTRKPS